MAISRFYIRDGQELSMSPLIYNAVQNSTISYRKLITKSGDRLDRIAFDEYDNAYYWWIIASASGIGWWLQMPEDIVLFIPTSLDEISNLKGLG